MVWYCDHVADCMYCNRTVCHDCLVSCETCGEDICRECEFTHAAEMHDEHKGKIEDDNLEEESEM